MKKQRLISLGIAVAAIASVVLLYRFVLIKKLVSDDYVRSLYSSHKDEIERLKSMCLEDQKKSGIGFFAVSAHSPDGRLHGGERGALPRVFEGCLPSPA